jgi:ABC-type branched-subunit amino acid transport system substrate-binding protein
VQRINADPSLLGGMRVEFVFEDVGCGTYAAVSGVQKLLSDPKIDAIFGPGMESCTIALL